VVIETGRPASLIDLLETKLSDSASIPIKLIGGLCDRRRAWSKRWKICLSTVVHKLVRNSSFDRAARLRDPLLVAEGINGRIVGKNFGKGA